MPAAAGPSESGKVTIDTPQMVEGLARWKTIVKESLTPRDLAAGEVRQMFADGKIALKIDGPWLWPIIQKGKAEGPDQARAWCRSTRRSAARRTCSGSPTDISDENKKLVWDFIQIATSDKFQSTYATLGASPPPSPRADTSAAKTDTPHFDLLVAGDARQPPTAKVDRIPKGLETAASTSSRRWSWRNRSA